MKSFACVVMGMAMIAVVVPVESALIYAEETLEKHYCKKIPRDPAMYPEDISCDPETGSCKSSTKTYFIELGECVYDNTENAPSCYKYDGVSHQTYTVRFIDEGLFAAQLGLNMGGAVICAIVSIEAGIGGGLLGGQVGAGIGATVVSVICAGVVFALNFSISPCDFGYCKVDWTIQSVPGPLRPMCQ